MFCFDCNTQKLPDDYYNDPGASTGRMAICKDCHKQRMKLNRLRNPDVRMRDRERASSPERIAKATRVTKAWRVKNPAAYRAQNAVNNAVRDGKLKKEPCAICAASKVHAHHKDYSKPLEVVWLCARCHHRLHAIFPELEGKKKSNENA